MNLRSDGRKAVILVFALLLLSAPVGFAVPQEYSFKVRNIGNNRVTRLLASEDGKNWRDFNIGNGIAPGEIRTVVWDKSTNSQACVQFFKAAFDDGEESPPKKYDFCVKDLVINVR